MNHFVQNKSQAIKALEDRMNKEKLNKLIPNLQPIFQIKKKQNKKKWMHFYLLHLQEYFSKMLYL